MAKSVKSSGFIYLWRDRKNNRYYIGCHWGLPDDGYICSSDWMRRAYRNRPNDFKRRVLEVVVTTRSDLFLREYAWLSLIKDNELGKRYYNFRKSIHNLLEYTPEIRKKMISAQIGRKQSPEHIAKKTASIKKTMSTPEKKLELSIQAKAMWSREGHTEHMSVKMSEIWTSEEHRAKTIPNIVATLNSEETVKKISEKSKQMWQDPAYRQLQSEKRLGIPQGPRSEEAKESNRLAQLSLWSTEEHRQKMSQAHLNSELAMESSKQNIKKTHTPEAIAKSKEVKRMRHEELKNDPEYRKMKKEAARIAAMKRWHPELIAA